jgi:hypothetical protein
MMLTSLGNNISKRSYKILMLVEHQVREQIEKPKH